MVCFQGIFLQGSGGQLRLQLPIHWFPVAPKDRHLIKYLALRSGVDSCWASTKMVTEEPVCKSVDKGRAKDKDGPAGH